MLRVKGEKGLPSLTSKVLDVMGLIEDHVMPLLSSEDVLIRQDDLVGGDANVELVGCVPAFPLVFPFLLTAIVGHDFEAG
jgi:hypothetical protein